MAKIFQKLNELTKEPENNTTPTTESVDPAAPKCRYPNKEMCDKCGDFINGEEDPKRDCIGYNTPPATVAEDYEFNLKLPGFEVKLEKLSTGKYHFRLIVGKKVVLNIQNISMDKGFSYDCDKKVA